MAQSFTNHTYYKVYDGSAWKIISFKTDAADVGESSTLRLLKPATHTVNGQSFYSNGDKGIVLYAGDIKLASGTDTTISEQLSSHGQLIAALQTTVSGLQTQDADLTAIAGLTGTGFLKRTGNNTWELDTNTYLKTSDISSWAKASTKPSYTASEVGAVPTSRTVNSKALSSNITLYGTDIAMSSSDSTTVKAAIDNVVTVANGKTKSYVSTLYNGSGYYVWSGTTNHAAGTTLTTSNANQHTIASSTSSFSVNTDTYLYLTDTNGTKVEQSIAISTLNIGDVLLLTDVDKPDFWVSSKGSAVTFSKLETTKVDLSGYATQTWVGQQGYVTSSSLSTTLAGYSTTGHTHTTTLASDSGTSTVTLAYGSKYKLTAGGTSVIFTMPSSDNTNTWRPIAVAGTNKVTDTSTALNFVNTGNVTFTYDSGVKASVDLSAYIQNNRITVASAAPSSPKTNDIWLDTSA